MSEDDTVTVTFIANYEVDPSEVEVAADDGRFRRELCKAIVPNSGVVQEVLGTNAEALQKERQKIWEGEK